MKRQMRHTYVILRVILVLVAGCMTVVSFCPVSSVKAYTEAEKKQAKAWLSAHGYPPTKGGAYQAYSDYMSGKLKLSEEDQKRVNRSLGKTNNSEKKTTKEKTKKKKAKKKTKKETGTEAASAEKKGQATASPTASSVSTATPSAATPTDDSDKQETEKSDTGKPATGRTKWETFGIVGGALLLIIVLVLVRIRRRK